MRPKLAAINFVQPNAGVAEMIDDEIKLQMFQCRLTLNGWPYIRQNITII